MAITKQDALTCNEFHYGECRRIIGPRGGITEQREVWRRNGQTQTWVTRPEDFRVPIKFGLHNHWYVTNLTECDFHTQENCLLNDPDYATADFRKVKAEKK